MSKGRPFKRFGLWLVALALGFGVGAVVAVVSTAVLGDEGGGEFVSAFFGVLAWGACGVVATWWFSRPRPRAHLWLQLGLPLVAGVAFVAATAFPGLLLFFPLAWFAAFWAAILPYEAPDAAATRM